MEDLYTLVRELSPTSFKGAKKYLLEYGQRRYKSNRSADLLEFLRSAEDCPAEDLAIRKLSLKSGNSQFRVVKSRLKKRLLEYLSTDLSFERPLHEDHIKVEMRVRKNLLRLVFLLRTRGSSELCNQLIDQIVKEAWEYELFGVLKEVFSYKKILKGHCDSIQAFNEIDREVRFVTKCEDAVRFALDQYYQLIMWEGFFGKNSEKKKEKFLINTISELSDLSLSSGSTTVSYYQKLLELSYYSNKNNFQAALQTAEEMAELVEKYKAVYRKSRVTAAKAQKTKMLTYLRRFDEAEELSQQILESMRAGSINYLVSAETHFHILFYNNRFDHALRFVRAMLKFFRKGNDFRRDQFKYFEAAALFQLGEFTESLKCLRENLIITRDRAGWGLGYRLLRIMNLIELGRDMQAMSEIETIRKYIARYGDDELNKREKIILRILKRLEKTGFDYSAFGQHDQRYISLLRQSSGDTAWEFFMPELVRFDHWLDSKQTPFKNILEKSRPSQGEKQEK